MGIDLNVLGTPSVYLNGRAVPFLIPGALDVLLHHQSGDEGHDHASPGEDKLGSKDADTGDSGDSQEQAPNNKEPAKAATGRTATVERTAPATVNHQA